AAEFGEQHARVDDDAVADHVLHTRGEDARRDEVQGELVAVREYDRVAGVVTALVSDNPVDLAAEQVGGLPFALVAPLGSDKHDRGHDSGTPSCGALELIRTNLTNTT